MQADLQGLEAAEQVDQDQHDNLQALMDRHKFDQMKLEQVMRALENNQALTQL